MFSMRTAQLHDPNVLDKTVLWPKVFGYSLNIVYSSGIQNDVCLLGFSQLCCLLYQTTFSTESTKGRPRVDCI